MRSIIFAIIPITTFNFSVTAQKDKEFLDILDTTVRYYQISGTVHYADQIPRSIIKSSIKSISKRKIVSQYDLPDIDSILLTKKEVAQIKRDLKNQLSFFWPDNLITDSKRIQADSIVHFVRRLNRHLYDSVKALNDSNAIINFLFSSRKFISFAFSKPIYIRHDTVFLMYFMWYTGTGGSQELTFYKKIDGRWKQWLVFDKGWW